MLSSLEWCRHDYDRLAMYLSIDAYIVEHMRAMVYALYRPNGINVGDLDGSSPTL